MAKTKPEIGDVYRIPMRGVGIWLGDSIGWLTLGYENDIQYPKQAWVYRGWSFNAESDFLFSLADQADTILRAAGRKANEPY